LPYLSNYDDNRDDDKDYRYSCFKYLHACSCKADAWSDAHGIACSSNNSCNSSSSSKSCSNNSTSCSSHGLAPAVVVLAWHQHSLQRLKRLGPNSQSCGRSPMAHRSLAVLVCPTGWSLAAVAYRREAALSAAYRRARRRFGWPHSGNVPSVSVHRLWKGTLRKRRRRPSRFGPYQGLLEIELRRLRAIARSLPHESDTEEAVP
jgi:hypothetical protein